MEWHFDNTYARELEGFYVPVAPMAPVAPELVLLNEDLAEELGLDVDHLSSPEGLAELSGTQVPAGAAPIAQAYAGHQFGQFSPLLGDGRALLLGELIDRNGRRRDIGFKGSGPTPFSRGGDGFAVVAAVLREYLIGEAMHGLGIPTTRALAAVKTGATVRRERREDGALLTRVAASHLRVGTFELVRSRGTAEQLQQLADYAIARHYPRATGSSDPARALLGEVVRSQAELLAAWMSVGFIHGVMNTDNMTISGETIDYGPCAFLDAYDPHRVFSSIDTGGRYRFGNQPAVAAWNLSRFAETLLPLLSEDQTEAVAIAEHEIERFFELYDAASLRRLRSKLGLVGEDPGDATIAGDLLVMMQTEHLDFTSTWRALARDVRDNTDLMRDEVLDRTTYDAWRQRWLVRLQPTDRHQVAAAMDRVNPAYIPRNHLVEEALAEAREGNLDWVRTLLTLLKDPYELQRVDARYLAPAPEEFNDHYLTYCGT